MRTSKRWDRSGRLTRYSTELQEIAARDPTGIRSEARASKVGPSVEAIRK
ncbi:hypothetical protein M7I_4897 [Glarea lozoyensis 74030]|uniref:Uncharacterized protein n=1 Tax=Glarea lozoyensis (strain ATCC 74030 / MF5533) TaxID=1104152 RepID=H0EQE9_GLAL7|nr:hypothetical protein M7I_4897 [Glarea lozoyensis 74030]